MTKVKKERKGTIITIGADIKKRIPRCMDDIYKVEALAVTDGEDLERDETFRMYTLRTILVEGTTIVDGGRAVNVNGEFDISLEPKSDSDEECELLDSVYSEKEEAIAVWETLTESQLKKAKKEKERMEEVVLTLQTSFDEKQY